MSDQPENENEIIVELLSEILQELREINAGVSMITEGRANEGIESSLSEIHATLSVLIQAVEQK